MTVRYMSADQQAAMAVEPLRLCFLGRREQLLVLESTSCTTGLPPATTPIKVFLKALSKDFDLSDSGELSWLLGCNVEQSPGKVRLHQEKYCNDVIWRFKMSNCNLVSTPCEENMHLSDAD